MRIRRTRRFSVNQFNRVGLVERRGRLIKCSRVHIPRIVLLGSVFEKLQFVAAGAGREGLRITLLQARDASTLFVDNDVQSIFAELNRISDFRSRGANSCTTLARQNPNHLVAQRRHAGHMDGKIHHAVFLIN